VSRLEANGLTVRLGGRDVLSDVTFDVQAGQALALTGHSGSGKTVLLHVLAGLVPLSAGSLLLDEGPVTPSDPIYRASVGLILQTHGLASGLTAEENVALPLQARGFDRAEIAERCRDALAAVDLESVATRLVDDLSGGQRQRVGVARALAGQPSVLLADEPTAELDPGNRNRILDLLVSSATRLVVVASNDPEVIAACPRVLELDDGRLNAARPS